MDIINNLNSNITSLFNLNNNPNDDERIIELNNFTSKLNIKNTKFDTLSKFKEIYINPNNNNIYEYNYYSKKWKIINQKFKHEEMFLSIPDNVYIASHIYEKSFASYFPYIVFNHLFSDHKFVNNEMKFTHKITGISYWYNAKNHSWRIEKYK